MYGPGVEKVFDVYGKSIEKVKIFPSATLWKTSCPGVTACLHRDSAAEGRVGIRAALASQCLNVVLHVCIVQFRRKLQHGIVANVLMAKDHSTLMG